MLEIEMGYEGKHDFPAPGQPTTTYMLATIPRTGSSWYGQMLWATGCLGAPLEYLNFDAGHYAFARHSAAQQEELWRSVRRRRTSPNGVFGVKVFPMHLETLEQGNPGLLQAVMSAVLSGKPPRIIYLRRRDRVAHAVSYARATLSGVWRAEQETGGTQAPDYSEAALKTAEQWIDTQEGAWEAMFRDLGIAPLRVFYEDLTADPVTAAAQAAEYLGVSIDPAAAIDVPQVRKQAGSDWAERYASGG